MNVTRKSVLVVAAIALAIGAGGVAIAKPFDTTGSPAACATPPDTPPPPPTPTTITTLQQAYECILTHYVESARLDDRALLAGGFASFTRELQRRGLDTANATLPAFTGNRGRDWAAFAKTYQNVLAAVPDTAELRQALAAATMTGMLGVLPDNHIGWNRLMGSPAPQAFGFTYTFEGRPSADVPPKDVRDAIGPMYLTRVAPESAAANAGLEPGDIIEAIAGVPVFVRGKLTPGALDLLRQETVELRVNRPASGATWTVKVGPSGPPNSQPGVSTVLLDGGIVHVTLSAFDPGQAEEALAKIAESHPRGVILDLRGNGGGDAVAVAKLLGAFGHGKVWGWSCDAKEHCTPSRTDDSVPLLNVPLVVLTDGRCASACDAFSAAIKDLRLGTLVGARTAGVASGLPESFMLNDNSLLSLITTHGRGPNREIIDGIGVAVDHQAPMTAADLSAGRDPGVAKALSLLSR
jgi:carboxyl-terminal processing protease